MVNRRGKYGNMINMGYAKSTLVEKTMRDIALTNYCKASIGKNNCSLGYCVAAGTGYNWYLSILIYSLYQKRWIGLASSNHWIQTAVMFGATNLSIKFGRQCI
jgi:hypothetical protein